MNIRSKITLLSTIWLFCILAFVDTFVVLLFVQVAIRNESESLRIRADHIVADLGTEQLLKPLSEKLLVKYLPNNAVIRVVNPQGQLINLMYNDQRAIRVVPRFADQYETSLDKTNRDQIVTVRIPLMIDSEVQGTLEIAERMESLDSTKRSLEIILFFMSLVAVFLCLISGTLLSNTILRPVTKLIRRMRQVESSLEFKPITPPGSSKDELYQLANSFNRMMKRIEDSLSRQKQFVSDASHELNTSLTIIEGYASMLRRWGNSDEKIAREAVDSIYQETVRLKKMTRQMLKAALGEQKQRLEPKKFDAAALVRQIVKPFRVFHKREIRVETEREVLPVYADPFRLKQLLLILIDNALKYSKTAVWIHLALEREMLRIEVEDYGVGIPAGEIPHVFERFYRVDKARARKTGGSGLGLSIAKSIVELHKGSIRIESEEGKGTKVTVLLPIETYGQEEEVHQDDQ